MPPRFAYWTILIDDKPTAFRAREREELLPTFTQLKRTNQNVAMKWFAQGQLWDSPEAQRAAGRQPTFAGDKRGPDWRPGGTHKDPRDRFKKKNRPERAWSESDPSARRDRDKLGPPPEPRPWRDKPGGPRGNRTTIGRSAASHKALDRGARYRRARKAGAGHGATNPAVLRGRGPISHAIRRDRGAANRATRRNRGAANRATRRSRGAASRATRRSPGPPSRATRRSRGPANRATRRNPGPAKPATRRRPTGDAASRSCASMGSEAGRTVEAVARSSARQGSETGSS